MSVPPAVVSRSSASRARSEPGTCSRAQRTARSTRGSSGIGSNWFSRRAILLAGSRRLVRQRLALDRLELLLADRSLVEQVLRGRDLRGWTGYRRGRLDLVLGLLDVPFGHSLAVDDQVDQHAEERQDDQEDHPERLQPPRDVMTTKHVDQNRDQDPDPDHPGEEDDHRPEDVQERIVSCEQHAHLPRFRLSGLSHREAAAAATFSRRAFVSSWTKIWIVAASGTAVSAPSTPSRAPKSVTATMMKKPERLTARPWIFGVRMLFSTCW